MPKSACTFAEKRLHFLPKVAALFPPSACTRRHRLLGKRADSALGKAQGEDGERHRPAGLGRQRFGL